MVSLYPFTCKLTLFKKEKSMVLEVNPTNTIAELKYLVQRKTGRVKSFDPNFPSSGIPPNEQRFIFAGKELNDRTSVSNNNIQSNSTVHLLLRLRGGVVSSDSI